MAGTSTAALSGHKPNFKVIDPVGWTLWGELVVRQSVVSCPCLAFPLHWRHNDHDGVSNHQPHGCSLIILFRRRSKKTSKLRVTGLCVGDRWTPRTKGQLRGKCFHLMTSSCEGLLYLLKSFWTPESRMCMIVWLKGLLKLTAKNG